MRFVRERIEPVPVDQLRTIGARSGWLVETTDIIRSGFGDAVDGVDLSSGLGSPTDAVARLRRHELTGSAGPSGTGVVAFGALPFDRAASGLLEIPRYVITQTRSGLTWLTSLEGSPPYVDLMIRETPPIQETQSLRSLTFLPTPEEYAHNVALAVEILRRKEIDKVVLARAVLGSVPEPLDAAHRLREVALACRA